MTKIRDLPVLDAVPAGGYVIVTEPAAGSGPNLSTFAKVLPATIGFLPLTGGTVTGDLTVQGAGAVANGLMVGIDTGFSGSVVLNGVKQSPKAIYLRTGGLNRWIMQSDAANETGGNSGSNFALSRYSDAGNLLGNAVTIARLDGTTQFYAPVYLSGDPTAPTGAATKQYVDAHAITSAAMAAWFATLPTTPPPASGQPWNNGGTLSFTF